MVKIKNGQIFNIGVLTWAILQKLLVNNFEWINDFSQFNEDFIKNYNEL